MAGVPSKLRYRPFNLGRWLIWGLTALVMVVLPQIFTQGYAITLMSQMGIMIVFALSYNMLLGQGGMLSFGHAVYSGLGAYVAVHTLNLAGSGQIWMPVSLLPLVGGLGGAFFGVLFGYVTTKRSGTTFAMITLGIAVLVDTCATMFRNFFGGEGGISTDRVIGKPFLGITYGPGVQVYYLIAVWCLASMALMYAWSHTPLGRIANAVRDNPERAEFIGYDTQRVRWFTLIISAFFAGIAGGLSTINFEIVTPDVVSLASSGGVLLATFIGGIGFFFGPILGAVVFSFFAVALSGYTNAWQFYLGLFFVLMVLYAPGGIASLIMMQLQLIARKRFKRIAPHYLAAGASGLLLLAALILTVEMTYKLSENSANGTVMNLFGINFDAARALPWAVAVGLWIVGGILFNLARKRVARVWGEIQTELLEARA
ncbi:MAG TPA: branched-chain amino acid ABC transporter permease [Burkholderiales bacterium]|nr:branched-chain amino acid ABC transporter permease [Burkholderiales bacterium]